MISSLQFKNPYFEYANYPFPPEVANDPMVLYHASSSCFERDIDSEGIKQTKVHFHLEELKSIANLFKQIGWMGKPGSMTTLEPFSINHDNLRHKKKPIFLGISSYQVVCYARYQNSGGEIAKAVRYCFQDLYEYLENENLRNEIREKIDNLEEQAKREGWIYDRTDPKISLEELEKELKSLEHINQRAISFIENTEYGIVYAIKFEKDHCKDLKYHNSMGIKYFKNISPEQIVGKAIVPKEYQHDSWRRGFDILYQPEIMKYISEDS